MILVDANLLVYARFSRFPEHARARRWLEDRFNSPVRIGLPWESLLGFVRLATHRRIFDRPLAIGEAWEQVSEWLDCPNAWIPLPTERHREILGDLLARSKATGPVVMDAHLGALALEHGLKVESCDSDFGRFPGVRWENPLQG